VIKWLPLAATVVAGGLVAMQAPINSTLGRSVGTFAAASVSFAIGLALLVTITPLAGEGFGDVGQARHLQWYYLTGGVLGAAYVTTVLVSVRTVGAGGTTAATIAGQLTTSVLLDRFGLLGLEQRGLSAPRLAGIALLASGVFLIVRD
jgi:bacterial/archaeal transporter family-2 protein